MICSPNSLVEEHTGTDNLINARQKRKANKIIQNENSEGTVLDKHDFN